MNRPFALWILLALSVAGVAAAGNDRRLVDAVERQDQQTVRTLLSQRVDVNTPQADGATALAWAAHWDDADTADVLIRAGANVNAANDLGVTPLFLACENGNGALVERLLKAGANPNASLTTGETLLMTAARTGSVPAVKALLQYGAQVNVKKSGRGGQTALMWAVAEQHADVARLLVEAGADVHARSTGSFTPLLFAARQGDVSAARILVDAGARVDDAASDGGTPLTVAIASNHAAVAMLLLDRGADANAAGVGYAALHAAVRKGQLDVAKALLAHGASPNARLVKTPALVFGDAGGPGRADLTGATPLIVAARAVNAGMVRLLIENGADPRLTTNDGTTPLMVAAGLSQPEDIKAGRTDESAQLRWEETRALETVTLLMQVGADINGVNQLGNTALHGAAYMGGNSVVQFLVDKGAKLDAQDKKGQTPFRIAEGHQGAGATFLEYVETAALFKRLGANTSLGVDARPQFHTNADDAK